MENIRKNLIPIGIITLILFVLVKIIFTGKTPEQIQAREEAKIERMRAAAEIETERQRLRNEELKIQAEIQAAKPIEVQTAEIQAEAIKSQTTTGDAILGTAGIAAGAYIFSQLLK